MIILHPTQTGIKFKPEYGYLIRQLFAKDKYKDVRNYIISVGCRYFFKYIPLKELGLQVSK